MGQFQDLKAQAAIIRDEQNSYQNTSLRVGRMFIDILEQLEKVLPDENVKPETLTVEATETSYKLKFSTLTSDGSVKSRELDLPIATDTKAGVMSPALMKGIKDQISQLSLKVDSNKTDSDNKITELNKKFGVKTIVFPNYDRINIDLEAKKVIISTGSFYYTDFNSNKNAYSITEEQEIDISEKLSNNSALLFDTSNNTFSFINYRDQYGNVSDSMAIIALLNNTDIYYVACDISVNGKRFGPINAQNKLNETLSKVDYNTLPIVGFSDATFTINRTTGDFTYEAFNVLYGKNKYAFNQPAGSGTYIKVNQKILSGINSILFNIKTKEIAWISFEKYSDYATDDWIAIEYLIGAYPILGFVTIKDTTDKYLSRYDKLNKQVSDLSSKLISDIDSVSNELKTTADGISTILWSNLFEGSDMEKGYRQDNIKAFSTYPPLGGTVERVLDNENSRYCIKVKFPSGTEFTGGNNYIFPSLMKNINFIGEDTTQEFSISFRYKCSSNFIGLCPLCNNGWMEFLTKEGNWSFLGLSNITLIKDNKWHYFHIVTRKKDVSNKTYSVGLYAYFAQGTPVTLEEDLDFSVTDIVISTSRFPDYADVKNKNDYLGSVSKETLQPVVDEIISEFPDLNGCVFMSLGDSITTESYYITKLRQLISPSKYYNLAVASATWADRSGTTSYDGNPQFQGDQNQNVLGNQVQKIINNPETYNVAPDVIIIAAGTNDGTPISADKTDYEMRVEIDSHFNSNSTTPISVTEPTFDDSDTYKEHRRTIAGAMRYCVLKLQSMYPKARIYILTPIQGSYNPNKDYLTQIDVKQRYITEVARHLAVPVIHVGEECGINRDFEYGGAYWKEEWADESHPKQGRDLGDGLHPNTSGSWKMAKYIFSKLRNDYIDQNY